MSHNDFRSRVYILESYLADLHHEDDWSEAQRESVTEKEEDAIQACRDVLD